jgi:DNA polymerase
MAQAFPNDGMTFEPLIAARKSCRICLDLSPGKIHCGSSRKFDPEVVSYWSQWLGHPKPKLLIVGQDFGDIAYFDRFQGLDEPHNQTNENLYKLLKLINLQPAPPPQRDTTTPVFLTNAILCLKEPPMNRPVLDSWIRSCAVHHLRPLLDALRPPIVVAMGGPAWKATRIAANLPNTPPRVGDAAGNMWTGGDGQRIFCVGHCGGLGLRNRPIELQRQDWLRIGESLQEYL